MEFILRLGMQCLVVFIRSLLLYRNIPSRLLNPVAPSMLIMLYFGAYSTRSQVIPP